MIYAFAGCELDVERHELTRQGEPVEVEPKVFELLLHLVRHHDRVVSRRELLEAVWPGVVVVEGALARAVSLARVAVGDRAGKRAQVIRTLRGAGFRLVADVVEVAPGQGGDDFVGREALLAELDACWARARAGAGTIALLAGEPGIGKTRLAEELARRVRSGAGRVLVARAHESESSPPYWMWGQLLRGFAREAGSDALLSLDAVDPRPILSLVPDLAPGPPEAPAGVAAEAARFRLYDALADFMVSAARQRPLLVLLDDLHWADRSSLRALAIAAPELARSRALVVATYRDEELSPEHPLGPLLAAAARVPGYQHFRLPGLAAADVARFAKHALGAASSARVARALYERSAGNPLFLRQLIQLIRERSDSELPTGVGIEAPMPPELRVVILDRVERLDPGCRELLAGGAVIGCEFELAVLAEVVLLDAGDAAARLDPAVARGLLREPLPGRYRFTHQLIQETLRESLPRAQRAALHRSVAEALAAAKQSSDELAAQVAYHHYEAARAGGDARAALHWARRAGEIAVACLAHDEAAAHFGRALEALELERRGLDAERCELLVARAEALSQVGDVAAARGLFLRAAEIASALALSGLLVRALLGLGRSLPFEVGERDAEQIAWVERALESLASTDYALRAELVGRLAFLVYWSERPERCLAYAEEAVRLARASGDARALALALAARFTASERSDRRDPRPLADELLASAQRAGVAELIDFGFTARILARFRAGDAAGGSQDLEAQRVHAERTRNAMLRSHNATLRGMVALFRGRADEAEALAFEGLRLGERYEDSNVRQAFGSLLLAVRLEQGRGEELEPALRGLLARWPAMPIWSVVLGWLLASRGERQEASALLRRVAADGFAGVADDHLWNATVSTAALLCGTVGDARIARSLYAKLSPCQGLVVTGPLGPNGPFDWYLGRLARVFGDRDAAEAHLDRAVALADAMGSPLYAGRARCELAQALLDADAPGAGERARALLSETLSALAPCDLPALAAEARGLGDRLAATNAGGEGET